MEIDDDFAVESISNCLYQTLVIIKGDRPGWFKDKARDYPWEDLNFQTKFVNQLVVNLGQSSDLDEAIELLIKLLQSLLFPPFFVSIHFTNLLAQIRPHLQPDLAVEEVRLKDIVGHNRAKISESISGDRSPNSSRKEPFAILLLDAENLALDCQLEQILIQFCQYPLKIKFAFANWHSLGKKDWDFHNRGYELIHVPQGKNSADLKMIAFGSSLSVYYPQAKEVFICSSDTDLNHLSTKLEADNLIVYRVYRRKDKILIFNSRDRTTKSYSLIGFQDIPLLADFILAVKAIVRSEQKRTKKNWIDLDRIANCFKIQFNLSLERVVAHYFPEQNIKAFFDRFKNDFVIHQLGNKKIYLTIFEIERDELKTKISQIETNLNAETLNNISKLETALLAIVNRLIERSQFKSIPIADVANEFKKVYSISVNQVIKKIDLRSNYTKFLQKCDRFKLKKVGNVYFISVENKK